MRLRDYFRGIPVRVDANASAHVVAERINAAAGSSFWPFKAGVVGGVWMNRVRLRLSTGAFEYNAKPVLAGRLRETATGSFLTLRYRAPALAYLFYLVWYSLLPGFVVAMLAGGFATKTGDDSIVAPLMICGALFVLPLVMHHLGTRNADNELEQLLQFLSREAGATPALKPPHPRNA